MPHPVRERIGGALMIALGLTVTAIAARYRLGTLAVMGPGFFPAALGVILVFCGGLVAIFPGASTTSMPPIVTEGGGVDPRGWLAILAGIVAFIVVGRYGGLMPASFAVVAIAALGDRSNSWRDAVLLGLVMTTVSVGVFWWMLGLQMPLFRWG
ncbi:MAG: tripartite tricarboxylate transporter TctB family protein [Rhodospirillales bacterium]|nr:tripartite tricarboxylate transporter TctB family protein [Rhodospirillales bacterium]